MKGKTNAGWALGHWPLFDEESVSHCLALDKLPKNLHLGNFPHHNREEGQPLFSLL